MPMLSQSSFLAGAATGLIAGVGATVVQTSVGLAIDKLVLPRGHDNNIAPRLVNRLARGAGHGHDPARDWVLGTLFHLGYGAGWGACYALARRRTGLSGAVLGPAVAALIYATAFSRVGAGTLTRTERPPGRRRPLKQASLVAVPAAYAAALVALHGVLEGRLEKRRQARASTAAEGTGALVEHEYRLTVDGAGASAAALDVVRARFPDLASAWPLSFAREGVAAGPLGVGDRIAGSVPGRDPFILEATAVGGDALTFGTLEGHPEPGRLTLAASTDADGALVLAVRTRTRVAGWLERLGYALGGERAQGWLWRGFLVRWAEACGGRPRGEPTATSAAVTATPDDARAPARPVPALAHP